MNTPFPQIHETLVRAARCGFNALLVGPHGVGKTSMIMSVARDLGLVAKSFCASTLDPFADLIGIPVPIDKNGDKTMEFVRSDSVNQAELMFFDELNRAHPKVLNAILEIVQFKTVNGERLPRLKCVFAAMNPAGDRYHCESVDPALLDRFHIHIPFERGPDPDYFVQLFGVTNGRALLDWYFADLSDEQQIQVSSRRLEYIGQCLEKGINPYYLRPEKMDWPIRKLLKRWKSAPGLIEEFFRNGIEACCARVKKDINQAFRFAGFLPTLIPKELADAHRVLLSLPPEILARIKADAPVVFENTRLALARHRDEATANRFQQELDLILEGPACQSVNSATVIAPS